MKKWFLGLLAAVAALLGGVASWRRKQTEADEASKRVFEDNAAAAGEVREGLTHLQARAQRRAEKAKRLGVQPSSQDTEDIVAKLRRRRDAE